MSADAPRGGGAMVFSPPVDLRNGGGAKGSAASDQVAEDPLLLKSFSATPFVEFGEVAVGSSCTRFLTIINDEEFPQAVRVEKMETIAKAGFSLDEPAFLSSEVVVGPLSRMSLGLIWTPTQPGPTRQLLRFHVDRSYRLTAKLIGNCLPAAKTKKKGRPSQMTKHKKVESFFQQRKSMAVTGESEFAANETIIIEKGNEENVPPTDMWTTPIHKVDPSPPNKTVTKSSNTFAKPLSAALPSGADPARQPLANSTAGNNSLTTVEANTTQNYKEIQREFDSLSVEERARFTAAPPASLSSPRRQTVTVNKKHVLAAQQRLIQACPGGSDSVASSRPAIVHPVVREDQENVEICATNDSNLTQSQGVNDNGHMHDNTADLHDHLRALEGGKMRGGNAGERKALDATYVAGGSGGNNSEKPITSTPQPSPDCPNRGCRDDDSLWGTSSLAEQNSVISEDIIRRLTYAAPPKNAMAQQQQHPPAPALHLAAAVAQTADVASTPVFSSDAASIQRPPRPKHRSSVSPSKMGRLPSYSFTPSQFVASTPCVGAATENDGDGIPHGSVYAAVKRSQPIAFEGYDNDPEDGFKTSIEGSDGAQSSRQTAVNVIKEEDSSVTTVTPERKTGRTMRRSMAKTDLGEGRGFIKRNTGVANLAAIQSPVVEENDDVEVGENGIDRFEGSDRPNNAVTFDVDFAQPTTPKRFKQEKRRSLQQQSTQQQRHQRAERSFANPSTARSLKMKRYSAPLGLPQTTAESSSGEIAESTNLNDTFTAATGSRALDTTFEKSGDSTCFFDASSHRGRSIDNRDRTNVDKTEFFSLNGTFSINSIAEEAGTEYDTATADQTAHSLDRTASSVVGGPTRKATKPYLTASARSLNRTALNTSTSSRGASKLIMMKTPLSVSMHEFSGTSSSSSSSSAVRIALPFASSSGQASFDARWQEKQTFAFTSILNYYFSSSLDGGSGGECGAATTEGAVSAAAGSTSSFSAPNIKNILRDALRSGASSSAMSGVAPTREEVSLRVYTERTQMFRLRAKACRLKSELNPIFGKIEEEVARRRIVIRADKHVHKDLGAKERIIRLLLSFNPLWLRICIEAVFGEILLLSSTLDVSGVSRFLASRLLDDPNIAAKFSHPTVPHLYLDGYSEAIASHTLALFLKIVVFLDFAKTQKLIPQNPCLFNVNSEFKTTKSLLLDFSKHFLSGEGDLTKHLKYMGFPVMAEQKKIDEYEFGVRNLAVDLRDGIRLCKLVAIMQQQQQPQRHQNPEDILTHVRLQDSRLNKIHNVKLAMKQLEVMKLIEIDDKSVRDPKSRGFSPNDVVDGHRERTLKLLWKILLGNDAFGILAMLDAKRIVDEIKHLEKRLRHFGDVTDVGVQGLDQLYAGVPEECVRSYTEVDPKVDLLLRWIRLVSAFHSSVPVYNFSVSFSDGRVIAYLLHQYHPHLLAKDTINEETTQTFQCHRLSTGDGRLSSPTSGFSSIDAIDGRPVDFERRIENEKRNLKAVAGAVSALGGVPLMLQIKDVCNTQPNEEVIIAFVAFLCRRLLDLATEEVAARKIQLWWRIRLRRRKRAAGQRIHYAVLRWWKKRKAEIEAEKQERAAAIIARFIPRWIHRRRYLLQREAIVRLQRRWRATLLMRRDLAAYAVLKEQVADLRRRQREERERIHSAVLIIQRHWRATLETRRAIASYEARIAAEEEERRVRNWAAATIQAKWRATVMMWRDTAEYATLITSVIRMQRRFRATLLMRRDMFDYLVIKAEAEEEKDRHCAAVIVQRKWRATLDMRYEKALFEATKSSALIIQRRWRATLSMRQEKNVFETKKLAASIIQRQWKATLDVRREMTKFQATKSAIVIIQRRWRATLDMRQERNMFEIKKSAAMIIQRQWKATLDMRREMANFQATQSAIVVIQRRWRAMLDMRQERNIFKIKKSAAMIIQRQWKATLDMRCEMTKFQATKSAIVVIQRQWKATLNMHREMAEFEATKSAIVGIQRRWRATLDMRHERTVFEAKKLAVVNIQRRWRATVQMWREMASYDQTRSSVLVIQRKWRATRLMRNDAASFATVKSAISIIQTKWHATLLMRREKAAFQQRKFAALLIQNRLRATWRMREERTAFQHLQSSTLIIQRQWRATVNMRNEMATYVTLKKAVIVIQNKWKATLLMRRERVTFNQRKSAALVIQNRFRATWKMRQERAAFKNLQSSALTIQKRWRATIDMRHEMASYTLVKSAVTIIQMHWRATLLMRQERVAFNLQKSAALIIQNRLRATWRMRQERAEFEQIQSSALTIQRRWRATVEMRNRMASYAMLRKSASVIQEKWKATLKMRRDRASFVRLKSATIAIQTKWMATVETNRLRVSYLQLKSAAVTIQRKWRATRAARAQRAKYETTRAAVVTIQRVWIATLKMKIDYESYAAIKSSALMLQRRWKAHLAMRREFHSFQEVKSSALTIQRKWRATIMARRKADAYERVRAATIVIQRKWRATLQMRRDARAYAGRKAERNVAVTKIQRKWKATLLMRKDRAAFLVAVAAMKKKREEEAELRRRMEEEELRLALEAEARRVAIEEERRRAIEEEERRRAMEEEERRRAEEEERRREEEERKKVEEERRRAMEEEKRRQAQEEEKRRKAEEEEERRRAVEEQERRKAVEEEETRRAVEEQKRRKAVEEEERRRAQEEDERRAEEEQRRREEGRKKVEEEEEKRRRAMEEEERRQAQEEEKRRKAVEEEERRRTVEEQERRKAVEEEERRRAQEDDERRRMEEEEEAWRREDLEEEERRMAFEEKARRLEEERRQTQGKTRFIDNVDFFVAEEDEEFSGFSDELDDDDENFGAEYPADDDDIAHEMLNSFSMISEADASVLSAMEERRRLSLNVTAAMIRGLEEEERKREEDEANAEEKKRRAALKIQSFWRGHRIRHPFLKLVSQVRAAAAASAEQQLAPESPLPGAVKGVESNDIAIAGVPPTAAYHELTSAPSPRRFSVTAPTAVHASPVPAAAVAAALNFESPARRVAELRDGPTDEERNRRLSEIRQRLVGINREAREEDQIGNVLIRSLKEILPGPQGVSLPALCHALRRIANATFNSLECRESLADNSAPNIIWRIMRDCNRSGPCNEVRHCCVDVLVNLARHKKSAPAVVRDHKHWTELVRYISIYRVNAPELYAVLCTLLVSLVQLPDLATEFLNLPDRPVDRLRKVRDEMTRRASMQEEQIAQKKRQEHLRKLANSSRSMSVQEVIRPSFLPGVAESKTLQSPAQKIELILGILAEIEDRQKNDAQASKQQREQRRSLRQEHQRQQEQQQQRATTRSRRSVMSSGAAGCYLKVVKEKRK